MERFQIGDVVRFKSGGPCMTITALGAYSGWTMRPSDTASCRWFEGEKPQETVFDMALLEKVSSRGDPHRDRLHQPLDLLHEKKKRALPSRTP
jgi:uncharacterized protein YodC (DUF2158 family)